MDYICHDYFSSREQTDITEEERKELSYRVGRAFDLLVVAEVIEERLGSLYGLSNGALTITRSEAAKIHRHVRNLDNYFVSTSEPEVPPIDSKRDIANNTIRFLKGEVLNDLQLKERLVKDFIERRGIGKNMKVVNRYLKTADYVQTVLKAEEIVSEYEDGRVALSEPAEEAQNAIDEHYSRSGFSRTVHGIGRMAHRVRSRARQRYGQQLLKHLTFDVVTFLSIIGATWLFVRKNKKKDLLG